MDNLYSEFLLDLYKNPLNRGALTNAELQYKIHNPLCGDEIELFIKLNNNSVSEVGWDGAGCVVSQVGASLLKEYIKGKNKDELKKITGNEVIKQSGLTLNPTRLRCLLLAFTALQKILHETRYT